MAVSSVEPVNTPPQGTRPHDTEYFSHPKRIKEMKKKLLADRNVHAKPYR